MHCVREKTVLAIGKKRIACDLDAEMLRGCRWAGGYLRSDVLGCCLEPVLILSNLLRWAFWKDSGTWRLKPGTLNGRPSAKR